jgi:fructuronate reductase
MPIGCATVIAAWILHLRGYGAPLKDPGAGDAQTAAADPDVPSAVRGVLGTWDPDLPTDADLVETIGERINALEEPSS